MFYLFSHFLFFFKLTSFFVCVKHFSYFRILMIPTLESYVLVIVAVALISPLLAFISLSLSLMSSRLLCLKILLSRFLCFHTYHVSYFNNFLNFYGSLVIPPFFLFLFDYRLFALPLIIMVVVNSILLGEQDLYLTECSIRLNTRLNSVKY